MALEFKLPDIGEGIAEGEIVKWLVKAGDEVKEHQSVVEVMTDKATVEVPAPAAGKIVELRAKEGDTVPVGSVIFVLETGERAGAATPPAPKKGTSQPPPRPQKSPSQAQPAPSEPPAQPARSQPHAEDARPQPRPGPQQPAPAPQGAAASPSAQASAPSATSPRESGGAILDFKLPDIGEGIAEGEIVKWLVQVGDEVKEHQSVVEVMTDKATVEVPAPAAGRIARILAREGETVPVGKVIFSLATAGAAVGTGARSAPAAARPATEAESERAREPALAGRGQGAGQSGAPTRAPSRSEADGKILAVPSARRLARDLGIDLAEVPGSGRNALVRRSDVEAYAQTREAAPAAPSAATSEAKEPRAPLPSVPAAAPGEREIRTPFRGVRRKIAEAMTRSIHTAAHFTVVEEVDVTDFVKLREQAKAIGAESDVKVTFMPFIMKATAIALAKYPELNGRLDETTQEIVNFRYVNLGIATDTPNGLIVPVIKEVQSKSVLQLAAELNELAERTRAGKAKPEELKGSTFSITNAENIGGILATPIINFPDIAILGVHRIVKRPGVVETEEGDEIAVRQYMNFSCSVDHRLTDGANAARFLVYLKKLLENPGLLAL